MRWRRCGFRGSLEQARMADTTQSEASQTSVHATRETGELDEGSSASAVKPEVSPGGSRALVRRRVALIKVELGNRAVALRRAAGPLVTRSTQVAKRRTSLVSVQLRRFGVERATPAFTGLFRSLGRRLHPKALAPDYRDFLRRCHALFFDRRLDKRLFVPSQGRISLGRLNIPSQVRASGHDYRPTPVKVFEWAMSAVTEPLDRMTFVDYGAGKGRVLLLASRFPFEKIIGAEIALELQDDCAMNIAQYPRSLMKCRDVDCLRVRATTLPIPEQASVFYFFDPFDMDVFEKVLARIVRSYKRQRRAIYLICVGMDEAPSVAAAGIFRPVAFSWTQRLKHKLFSPYPFAVYRTEA